VGTELSDSHASDSPLDSRDDAAGYLGELPLLIERLEVGVSRVDATVRVGSDHWMRTSTFPGTAERTVDALPGIRKHRCECGQSHGIITEIASTETPHLLEHVALELMVLAGSPRSLRGDTRWDFATDGKGVFHVLLDYDDDLVALAALKEGALALPFLLGQGGAFDAPAVVCRLESLRGRSSD